MNAFIAGTFSFTKFVSEIIDIQTFCKFWILVN